MLVTNVRYSVFKHFIVGSTATAIFHHFVGTVPVVQQIVFVRFDPGFGCLFMSGVDCWKPALLNSSNASNPRINPT
eukprot:4586294-Amphidinium_carterae.1